LEALVGAGTFDPEVVPAAGIVAGVALDTAMDLYRSIDLLHSDGGDGGGSSLSSSLSGLRYGLRKVGN
jgi:hypothetical protein